MYKLKKNNFEQIRKLVRDKYLKDYPLETSSKFIEYFMSRWPQEIEAIIFYGSCLSMTTKKETSTPDFFLITNSYRSFHKNLTHSFLNWAYAPSTYSIREGEIKGKYNVLSLKDIKRELSPRAKDIYNLGRLSKRTALIYCKDQKTQDEMIHILADAFYSVTKKIFFLLPSIFNLDDFVRTALNISYVGERRVEAEDKISKLISSQEGFYSSVYELVLEDLVASDLLLKTDSSYVLRNPQLLIFRCGKLLAKLFIWRSRMRAKLRWPKSIYTFKGWADVLIAKIERARGIKLELSEKERRHPLIYGWKYYFKLKRDKLIK